MERSWLDRIRNGDIVLIDGGTGGELRRRGVSLSEQAWSGPAAREAQATLRSIHADFIRAGADVVTTSTFGSTRFVLDSAGLAAEFETINRSAVEAALQARVEAAERPVAIAGSISCFPPRFDPAAYPSETIERDAYRELAELLVDSGVDLIALEMIQDVEHGLRALEAALGTGLPVWLGVSARRCGDRVTAYDDAEQALEPVIEALAQHGPAVVNVMHTPIGAVTAAIGVVRKHWDGPLGVYPELGEPAPGVQPSAGIEPPAVLVQASIGWVGLGARLLGGCCGSGPEHIAALAAARPRLLAARSRAL